MGKDIEHLKVHYQTTSEQLQDLEKQVAKLSVAHEKVPYLFMLSDRNEWFSGRESELDNLHSHLQISDDVNEPKVQIASVCGLGGSGKTSIAAEYAHRWKDYYDGGVFWFSGENEAKFANSVDEHAVYFGTLLEGSPGRTLVKTLDVMSKIEKPWLLVLDDMDEYKLCSNIQMLLSGPWKRRASGPGHILITTRRKPKAMSETVRGFKESQCLQLQSFSVEDGKRFVFKRTRILPDEETLVEASTLVEILGGLPLALEQACAYICHLSCTLTLYLEQYNQCSIRLLNEQEATPVSHHESRERLAVHTTWLLNFNYIKESVHGKFAARFLHACAFFNPDEIQKKLINAGKPVIDDDAYRDYVASPLGSSHILKLLTDFSLFKERRSSLCVHRLVQEVIRDNFQPNEYVVSFVDAVRFLSHAFSTIRSPDDLLTSMVNKHHDRASLQATDPSRFHEWHKMCLHAHEVRKYLSILLKSCQVLDQRIVIPETARLVYECALHLNVNSMTAEAKEASDFAYRIIRRLGNSSLTKNDLATLFPHEIPLPELVRRVISYSCIAPRDDAKSLSSVENNEGIIPISDLKEQGNAYFRKGNFQKAVEIYSSAIKLTNGMSCFDPTLLSNRASAFIRLENFENGLKDAEDYILHRPNCWKGYARKALALHGLKRLWDAACAAALAYYFERNIFSKFEPFKKLFLSLKDRIHICGTSISSLVAPILQCNFRSQTQADVPRKIVIFEPGEYVFKTHMYICNSILIGIKDSETKRSPLLSLQGRSRMLSSGRIIGENVSFAFDTGYWQTGVNSNGTFVNCNFTSNAEQKGQAFLSFGDTTFTNCRFENCKEDALRIMGKSLVQKCVFSANGFCGVQVSENGQLEIMKECKIHGNMSGVYMGPNAGPCSIVDCEIYDNRKQGIVAFRSSNINLIGNRIYQNDRHGINLEGESFTHIERNEIFENCWYGIATMDNARCNATNNKVYRNKHGGIQVVPIAPGPEECHSVVENNEIFDNCGPVIYDEMMYDDDARIPIEHTYNKHILFHKKRKQMRKAKCRRNKERNNGNTKSENESETLDFCAFCREKKPLRNCRGCYSVGYCSKRCQKHDWTSRQHKRVCASLLQESSIVVNVLPKQGFGIPAKGYIQLSFNNQAPGLDPKGPEYANLPKYGERFIVKVQAVDAVRQSNLGGGLLTIYDRSMTIHSDLDWKHCPLYNIVKRCGRNTYSIGWTKMFFWAMLCNPDDHTVLRIFTERPQPYQNW